jgi:hypothetical protein
MTMMMITGDRNTILVCVYHISSILEFGSGPDWTQIRFTEKLEEGFSFRVPVEFCIRPTLGSFTSYSYHKCTYVPITIS